MLCIFCGTTWDHIWGWFESPGWFCRSLGNARITVCLYPRCTAPYCAFFDNDHNPLKDEIIMTISMPEQSSKSICQKGEACLIAQLNWLFFSFFGICHLSVVFLNFFTFVASIFLIKMTNIEATNVKKKKREICFQTWYTRVRGSVPLRRSDLSPDIIILFRQTIVFSLHLQSRTPNIDKILGSSFTWFSLS